MSNMCNVDRSHLGVCHQCEKEFDGVQNFNCNFFVLFYIVLLFPYNGELISLIFHRLSLCNTLIKHQLCIFSCHDLYYCESQEIICMIHVRED